MHGVSPPTILNTFIFSPTPVKFRAHFILGYQTRLEVDYYLRLLVSELCGLLLWSTTWLFLNCVGCCCGAARACF